MISIRIQIHLKPYKQEANNQLEMAALVAGMVTLMAGLVFMEDDRVGYLNTSSLIFIFFANLYFLSKWGLIVFKVAYASYKQRKVSRIVISRC